MIFQESETVELKFIVVDDIKTDGDYFEDTRSLEQDLTFEAAQKEFSERNIPFGEPQMKTFGLMTHDGDFCMPECKTGKCILPFRIDCSL